MWSVSRQVAGYRLNYKLAGWLVQDCIHFGHIFVRMAGIRVLLICSVAAAAMGSVEGKRTSLLSALLAVRMVLYFSSIFNTYLCKCAAR